MDKLERSAPEDASSPACAHPNDAASTGTADAAIEESFDAPRPQEAPDVRAVLRQENVSPEAVLAALERALVEQEPGWDRVAGRVVHMLARNRGSLSENARAPVERIAKAMLERGTMFYQIDVADDLCLVLETLGADDLSDQIAARQEHTERQDGDGW